MGFSLADVGLVSNGYNQAADADRLRQQAIEDREAQLTARRQAQEQAAAQQAEFQRQQAFQSDMRNTVEQYASSGPNATPGAPASTVPVPVLANSDEGEDNQPIAATQDIPAKPSTTNVSGMYAAMKDVALKHGREADFNAIKDRAEKFHQEGLLDFLRGDAQGLPPDKLEDIYNGSGDSKLKPGSLQKVGPGSYTATTTDGKDVSLDRDQILNSMLAPKDLAAHQDKSEKTAAVLEAKKAELDMKDRANAASAGMREARIQLLQAQAEAALAKANKDSNANGRGRTSGNWNQFDNQVRQLATVHLTALDPETGKPALDRKNMVALTSMASALARSDPDNYGSPGEAVNGAIEKMDEIKRIQDDALSQAEDDAAKLPFETPKARDRWVKSRTDGLTKMRASAASTEKSNPLLAGATATAAPAPAAAPAAPATATATSAPASGAPAEPVTQADFDALKPNTRFINPADGKIYVKS